MRKGRSNGKNPWCPPGKRSRIAPILRVTDPKGALQPYVRLAEFAKTQTQRIAASRFLVLRPADLRTGARAALREQPGVCRARIDGAEPRRLPYARLAGPRQNSGQERERHRAAFERLLPQAGYPARKPGQRPE